MATTSILHVIVIFAIQSTLATSHFTNLPPSPPGLFSANIRITIHNTSTSATWAALTNFPAYASWNPFVRYAAVVSPLNLTLPEQYPVEGLDLFLRTQIPPLPLPVNAQTPDNPLATQLSYEKITHVEPELGRLAWKYQPDTLLQAERWQAISDLGNGDVLYESREVFSGALAGVLKATLGEDLQKAFDAQGAGLKILLESS